MLFKLAKQSMIMTTGILFLWSCSSKKEQTPKGIEHIIVIGVDGMSPNGIQKASTPTLDTMIQNGSATMHARPVLPSSSSPNWASMVMGADTEQHGVTSNGWEKFDHQLPPVVVTENGTFPTIFTLFKDQQPEAHVGAIYDWDGFGRLFEKRMLILILTGTMRTRRPKPQWTTSKKYANAHFCAFGSCRSRGSCPRPRYSRLL